MAHDVFISHSTKNKAVADAVCATLENAAIRCWIAPRDVQFSRPFPGEITRAIKESKAIVLIFSADSNNSPQILRELQLAAAMRVCTLFSSASRTWLLTTICSFTSAVCNGSMR